MERDQHLLSRRRVVTLGATAVGVVTAGCEIPEQDGEDGGEGGESGGEEGGESGGEESDGQEGGEAEGSLGRPESR